MGEYDFKKDLQEGQKSEEDVLKTIKQTYPKAYRIRGYFKHYDIVIPEINKTIEVKSDRAVRETGNYFIETEFNKKDKNGGIIPVEAGILTTTADFWVIVDDKLIIIIEIGALRYIFSDYKIVTLPPKKTSLGGKGYLIKKSTLISSPYVSVISKSDKGVKIKL